MPKNCDTVPLDQRMDLTTVIDFPTLCYNWCWSLTIGAAGAATPCVCADIVHCNTCAAVLNCSAGNCPFCSV